MWVTSKYEPAKTKLSSSVAISYTALKLFRAVKMYEANFLSVIPPILAILLAIVTRQVILSLSVGIWIGFCILESVNPIAGIGLALDGVVDVFSDAGDTRGV